MGFFEFSNESPKALAPDHQALLDQQAKHLLNSESTYTVLPG